MTVNEAIVEAGWRVVAGVQSGVPERSGLCLQLVRVVVERACALPAGGWYRWRTHVAGGHERGDTTPWARDMERSLRAMGMDVEGVRYGPSGDPRRYVALDGARPGDLLFRWDTAKQAGGAFVGHVGVLMPGDLVLENVNPSYRNPAYGMNRGPNRLTLAGAWPVTTIVRFDPSVGPA